MTTFTRTITWSEDGPGTLSEEQEIIVGQPGCRCPDCGVQAAEPNQTKLYQCGECSEIFTLDDVGSNRCPSCGKMAARHEQSDGGKTLDQVCPDCNAAIATPEEVFECPRCGDLIDTESETVPEHVDGCS